MNTGILENLTEVEASSDCELDAVTGGVRLSSAEEDEQVDGPGDKSSATGFGAVALRRFTGTRFNNGTVKLVVAC